MHGPTPLICKLCFRRVTVICIKRGILPDEHIARAVQFSDRVGVGDLSLIGEIEDNARRAAPEIREFVLGAEEAARQQHGIEGSIAAAVQAAVLASMPSAVQAALSSELLCEAVAPLLIERMAAVAESIAAGYSVVEFTRSAGPSSEEQEWLCSHGLSVATQRKEYEDEAPLDIRGFLEGRLPVREHFVIVHVKGKFSQELKQRRVQQYLEQGNRFWVAYVQAQYRVVYTEADQDLMCEVWQHPEMQNYVRRKVELHRPVRPVPPPVVRSRAARRQGPYAAPSRGSLVAFMRGGPE
jgi:hypothetical protein